MRQGCLIVVSGPSGTGKGTVCSALLSAHPEIAYSISATTRSPREGERHGVNYYFLTKPVFETMISEGELLEWATVYGNYYGTPLQPIKEKLAAGQDILLEIDTQGALKVQERFPDGVFIFLLPPSLMELERRIRGRGTEDEASLACRLQAAQKEIGVAQQYHYVVVNDEVKTAVAKIVAILTAEHCRVEGNQDLLRMVSESQ
ncbi:MAG: guanylate kinase [Negativicutes bacterium]|jgi:guanylate kinase